MIETKTPEKIHQDISDMLANGVTYIDALVSYCKRNDLEIETVAEIVKKSDVIREKLREEGIRYKMVKDDSSTNRLFN